LTTETTPQQRGAQTKTANAEAQRLNKAIEQEFSQIQPLYDLMDEDFDRWSLKTYVIDQDTDGVIAPEDAYTTNNPRVLAGKIIAFLESTRELIRIPYTTEKEEHERANSDAERLAIGFRDIADKRLVRRGQGKSKNQLAWASTVRTGRIFLRGLLLKDERGDTVPDLLPFDPRHTAVRFGADEPEWVAVRKIQSRRELRRRFTGFKFQDEMEDGGNDFNEHESAFDVYYRRKNPDFDPDDAESMPFTYWNGVLTTGKWARKPEELFTPRFPVAVVATDATMPLSPTEKEDQPFLQEGSSIFAENRGVWDTKNRLGSYANHMAHQAADPPIITKSIDGEAELDEGANEPGSSIPLSTANDESVERMITADLNNASSLINQIVRTDELGGGLPPQAIGILDTPLSSVALRQLGLNIEQKVIPRMNAMAEATEYCLETMLLQYDTGEYREVEVIGRDFRGQRFQQNIQPEAIKDRQRLQVEMRLALPQDEQQRWAIAQIASQQTAFGEPLGDLDFVREEILNMPDPGFVTRQNDQTLAWQATPLGQILKLHRAAEESGDEQLQSIMFDQVQLTALQQTLQTNVQIQQLMQMAQGLGVANGAGDPAQPQGAGQQQIATGGLGNPATGAPGVAEVTGVGNTPSPEAGANTTAPRPGAQGEQAQRLAAIGLVPN
jgi:hypothetical protein